MQTPLFVCSCKCSQPVAWSSLSQFKSGCVCSYTYTAEDVKQMLAEKKARGTARMNIATEKAKLIRVRDHAQEIGDVDEVDRYIALLLVATTCRLAVSIWACWARCYCSNISRC